LTLSSSLNPSFDSIVFNESLFRLYRLQRMALST
jgi:hypothetical protein